MNGDTLRLAVARLNTEPHSRMERNRGGIEGRSDTADRIAPELSYVIYKCLIQPSRHTVLPVIGMNANEMNVRFLRISLGWEPDEEPDNCSILFRNEAGRLEMDKKTASAAYQTSACLPTNH